LCVKGIPINSYLKEGDVKVHQIFTQSHLRNFSYIIEGNQGHCYIIDPFDGKQCLDFVDKLGGIVRAVINTHEHHDHTQGNAIIAKKTACSFYAHPNAKKKVKEANSFLNHGDEIIIDSTSKLSVLDTPGHTFAHLCFVLIENMKAHAIFTGDTLFNAGIGHCRLGGNIDTYFETMEKQFKKLSGDLIVYPGHEYLENNLRFTLDVEPGNKAAEQLLEFSEKLDWSQQKYQTTMQIEREINSFLRLDNNEMKKKINLESSTAKEVFIRLRELRNNW
jgi:hydroxyacylglutathione hydrolase